MPAKTTPSGYSGTPLIRKLGIKPGMRVHFAAAPEHYRSLIDPLPDDVRVLKRPAKDLDFIHVFAVNERDLVRRLPVLVKSLAKSGMLWISWPKKTSALAGDLTGHEVRAGGIAAGLVDVKVCAVDEDWSGHKFCFRVRDR